MNNKPTKKEMLDYLSNVMDFADWIVVSQGHTNTIRKYFNQYLEN